LKSYERDNLIKSLKQMVEFNSLLWSISESILDFLLIYLLYQDETLFLKHQLIH